MTQLILRGIGLAIALSLTACALPHRLDGYPPAPTPLSQDLMQSGPQVEYRAPAREEVVGCVVVAYDIERDGTPQNVQIQESHPAGYFDAEVLNLMKEIRFRSRARAEPGVKVFSFVPRDSGYSREAAASLCSPGLPVQDFVRTNEETR